MLKVMKSLSSTMSVDSSEVVCIFLMNSFSCQADFTRYDIRKVDFLIFLEVDATETASSFVPVQFLFGRCQVGGVGASESAFFFKESYD